VTGDPLLVCTVLMRSAGGNIPGLDVAAFLQQADDFGENLDLLSRPGRFITELTRTHPFAVKRVRELTRWVREGDYDRIRQGSYIRRGQEPPPSEETTRATEHYRKRFLEAMERVAGGVQKLANQLGGFLRNNTGGGGDA
jgi:hypothetical protein